MISVRFGAGNSAFLELAINDLEKRGIARKHILAVPLDKGLRKEWC